MAEATRPKVGKPGPRIERTASLRWVPLNRMQVSDTAQRDIQQPRVDYLVSHMDIEQVGNPIVNERGGWFYIIDGQHRVAALREYLGEDQQIQCWTYTGLSEAEEAEKFLQINDVLTVTAFDRFEIGVEAGREVEVDIARIVEACGVVVSRNEQGGIRAVGTLRKVYNRGGPEVLSRTLTILIASFGESGLGAPVINGIGLMCGRYGADLDDEKAVNALRATRGGVNGLLGKAAVLRERTRQPLSQCVAAAAVEIINAGRGGKKMPTWWRTAA